MKISTLLFAATHPYQIFLYLKRCKYERDIRNNAEIFLPQRTRRYRIVGTGILNSIPGTRKQFESDANKILNGKLSLYGLVLIDVKRNIKWHRDYLSGYEWPKDVFYRDIKYNYPKGVDIKIPWEISRLQHLVPVALAYKHSKNKKYISFIKSHLEDWIRENKVFYGVNYLVAMEVAIRACNILLIYDICREDEEFLPNTGLYSKIVKSLNEHGEFIWNNLEHFGVKSNHYFSDIVGLIWIGLLCPDLPGSSKWLKFGLKEFEKEVRHQFRGDGYNFEGSTSYHRLVLEMAGYTLWLCNNHKIRISQPVVDRIKKAFESVLVYLKPNGQAPQFGDNDSGRMFIFTPYFNWDPLFHRYLVDLGELILNPNNIADQILSNTTFKDEEGVKGKNKIALPEGEVYILKNQKYWIGINGNPLTQDGNNGHNHDDAGSFELSYLNKNIIVDPGTACYTSEQELRNKFRSRAFHNAPCVISAAIPPLPNLFSGKGYSYCKVLKHTPTNLRGEITCGDYHITRDINLFERCVEITDVADENFEVSLTLGENITAEIQGMTVFVDKCLYFKFEGAEISIDKGWYSPGYRTLRRVNKIIAKSINRSISITISNV